MTVRALALVPVASSARSEASIIADERGVGVREEVVQEVPREIKSGASVCHFVTS